MRRWQLFLGIELALTLWLFFQIITNPMALTTILVGVFFLFLGARWHRLRSFNVAFGGILLVLGIFINPAIWLILMIAGVFIIMVVTKPGMGFSAWDRKQYVAPVTQEPSEKAGKRTINSWTDRHTISPTYDWDDINMVVPAGDTIIDFGDTFLPKGDSVIMIRKGFGKTRILVPIGVGVAVEHAAFYGTLHFENKDSMLHSQSVTAYSKDYDDAPRRIHIITSVGVGDLEVLAV